MSLSKWNVPVVGKSGFVKTEDVYELKPLRATKLAPNPQQVIIACKHKNRRVCGILSEGIKVSGNAQWEELFQGGITALAGSTLDTINNFDQLARGETIQQPWMNRKIWKSTKPFSLSFTLNYVATYSGKKEVFEPCNTLISFTYPRELSEDELSNFQKNKEELESKLGGITGNALKSIRFYSVPGPTIAYGGENADSKSSQGDPVTLVIGNTFAFGGVYLESVDVEYSSAMGSDGYPLSGKANIKATVMDVNTCSSGGSFNVSQYADHQNELSDLVQSIQQTSTDFKQGISNIVSKVIGFYKGGK